MDRFDDIWKNSFNAADIPVEDWNTPDDQVWASVAKTLPKPKRKKRLLWWWFAGFLVLASAISLYWLWTMESTQTAVDQLSIVNIQNTELESEVAMDKLIDAKKPLIEKEKPLANPTQKHAPLKPKAISDQPIVNKVQKTASTYTTTINTNLAKQVFIPKPSIDTPFLGKKNEVIPSTNMIEPTTEKVFLAPENTLGNLAIQPLTNTVALGLPSEKKWMPTTKKPISLSINTGIVFWQHQLNSDLATTLSPFDFNYTDGVGLHMDLEMAFDLNDYFKIFTGIGYDRVGVTSGHNSAIQYSLLDELNESDNKYLLSLATPYGFMDSEFSLRRTADISQEEVDLLVDFNSKHLIQNISVPLGLKIYPLGQRRLLVPSISTAFGVNYLASISNDLSTIDTHHDALGYQSNSAAVQKQAIEAWHFDARVGAGLTYKMPRKIDISVQYNFVKGLSPVFKLDNLNTKINRHYLNLTLTKTIN